MIIDSDASVIVPSTNFLYTEMIDENIIDSFVEWHYNHKGPICIGTKNAPKSGA